jgi:hypothetical protein
MFSRCRERGVFQVSQMALLMNTKLADISSTVEMDKELSFVLVNPTGGATRWSEVQVRVGDNDTSAAGGKRCGHYSGTHLSASGDAPPLSGLQRHYVFRFKKHGGLGQVTATQPRAASS